MEYMEFWFSVCSKWAGELQKMRSHMVGQPGHYLLWISIAGMDRGNPEHFKHNYLALLMTGFHLPVMEFPLRNTKEVILLDWTPITPTKWHLSVFLI